MRKKDELEREAARRFAWGMIPDDLIESENVKAPAEPEPAPENHELRAKRQLMREEAFEVCQRLADGVDRTWALSDMQRQAQSTEALWSQAIPLSLSIAAMHNWPLQSVRLARLLVRHGEHINPGVEAAARGLLMWLSYTHAEAGEFVLDVARAEEDEQVFTGVYLNLDDDDLPQYSDFGAKLGQLIDRGPSWQTRCMALAFADRVRGNAIVPALRRVLRASHLRARRLALAALTGRYPAALTEQDVMFLLEDAVSHALPEGGQLGKHAEELYYYPEELARAVALVRPAGGQVPLRRIVEYNCDRQGFRFYMAQAWALRLLAQAYPAHALDLVDESLRAFRAHERSVGVEAAAQLPSALARPRLELAAGDGCADVAEKARASYVELFGESCAIDELTTVVPLLDGHDPSERLRSRMLALRGPLEARRKMAAALLQEPPDRETLAALCMLLANDNISDPVGIDGLPKNRSAWCTTIVSRFGSEGIRALCLLARRYVHGSKYNWMQGIEDSLNDDTIQLLSPRDREVLAELATESLRQPRNLGTMWALCVASRVGFAQDLHEPLWRMAIDPDPDHYERWFAARALAAQASPEWIDRVLLPAVREALSSCDYLGLAFTGGIGVGRGLAEAIALMRKGLDQASELENLDGRIVDELVSCARQMLEKGYLDESWQVQWLNRPECAGFSIACRTSGSSSSRAARRAIVRALTSTARAGASAGQAAGRLLFERRMRGASLRVAEIFSRAPLDTRLDMLPWLVMRGAPLELVWPAVVEALSAPDLGSRAEDAASAVRLCSTSEMFGSLRDQVVDPRVRDAIREALRELEPKSDYYWQDEPTEEQEA